MDYSKTWKYDACAHREAICQYVTKKYCATCIAKKENTQIMKNCLLYAF